MNTFESNSSLAAERMRQHIANVLAGRTRSATAKYPVEKDGEYEHRAYLLLTPDEINIRDLNDDHFCFWVFAENLRYVRNHVTMSTRVFPRSSASDNTLVMHGSVYTRPANQDHPYLRSRELWNLAVEWFSRHGKRPEAVLGNWQPGSTNYRQFDQEAGRNSDPAILEHAAFKTWTGKRAAEMGFSVADVLDRRKTIVLSLFHTRQ